MPADIVPGIQRIIAGGSTSTLDGTTAPTTAAAAIPVRALDNRSPFTVVRASTTLTMAVADTTSTSDVPAYGTVTGMIVTVDQSAVAASSAGGGTGTLTHTIQFKDPIGGTYLSSTGVIAMTTGVAPVMLTCYPSPLATVVATTAVIGKADMVIPNLWRINTATSSSATTFTYSIATMYLPTNASSS